MDLETYQLNELMNEMDKKDLSALLMNFKCSRSADSEDFLTKASMRHEKKDISRTYLIIDPGEDKVLGYFTLALKCLGMDDAELDPETTRSMNLNEGIAQAYLIGQLARADNASPGSGRKMIEKALDIFTEGKKKFGCRMVRLDCKDELVDYYKTCGFLHIRKNHDKDLNQMAIFI